MNKNICLLRNSLLRFFYKFGLKPILFQIDPEKIHNGVLFCGKKFGKNKFMKKIMGFLFSYDNKILEQKILGIKFSNPTGLAAGFDKDGELIEIIPSVGFGFHEIGSITGSPCEGNPKPRLWRLKKSKGLVVYYGLKNKGSEEISERIRSYNFKIPLGTNIARTNDESTVELKEGIKDYVKGFDNFKNIGDYFTVNISCPNTCGGEPFTNPKYLVKLLERLSEIKTKKPVFLKLAPDLTEETLDSIIKVSRNYNIDGFICNNLSKKRNYSKIIDKNVPSKGGISGKLAEASANKTIRYIYSKTKGEFVIIGCGGIFTAEDAYRKIKSGASLVQLITGMIYEGPQVISEINQGLVKLLKKDGYSNISEAIGKNNVNLTT